MRTIYWILIPLIVILVSGVVIGIFRQAKPQVMQLTMPKPGAVEPPATVSAHDLTFLLHKQKIYYYFGPNEPGRVPVLHAASSMQAVEKVLKEWSQHSEGYVYIKTGENAPYKQMTAMLDEMNITNQQHYSIESQTAADHLLLVGRQP